MSAFYSQNSFDYPRTIMLPVIASFDSEGRIKPLYVRIHGKSYKIDSARMSSSFVNTVDFHCKIIDGDCLKPLVITFHRREGMWCARL